MWWQFWKTNKDGKLPESVRSHLATRFHLSTQVLDNLRWVLKSGNFARRPVRFLRIFDTTEAQKTGGTAFTYDDMQGHQQAVLFEGHIERDGSSHLIDKRPDKQLGVA
jgi:hypothetical protein